jgi:RNase P protein component
MRAAWFEVSSRLQEDIDIVLVARKTILAARSLQVAEELQGLLRSRGMVP